MPAMFRWNAIEYLTQIVSLYLNKHLRLECGFINWIIPSSQLRQQNKREQLEMLIPAV